MSKCYTCFGGSDIVIYLDNKVVAETEQVNVNTHTRQVEIKAIVFKTLIELSKELNSKTNSKLLFVFVNEHGDKMYRVISGVQFSHEMITYSIDKMTMYNSFIFDFDVISTYEEFSVSVDELREGVFNELRTNKKI